jgi:hypothetical protein
VATYTLLYSNEKQVMKQQYIRSTQTEVKVQDEVSK